MTTDDIRNAICQIADKYSICSVILFGSRAAGTNRPNSDVDLIVEFSVPVSILTLSKITCELEEILGLDVDVIHGPIRSDDILEIQDKVVLYAA